MITGGGLIGAQIARLEQQAGRHPVIFDVAPNRSALGEFLDLDRCTVVRGDVLHPLDLVDAVSGNDVRRIIHTAAFGGLTVGSAAAPLTSTHVNVIGTANVLEVARVLGLERVVLSSSGAIFVSFAGGEDRGAYSGEEAYPRPSSVYAANKQAAEDLGRAYVSTFGLDVLAVRYAAVFGPWRLGGGGGPTSMMEKWLRGAIEGEEVEIGPAPEDWIYSKDAAKGTHLACWVEKTPDRLFNLGTGELYRQRDIVEALRSAVPGAKVRVAALTGASPENPPMSIDRARAQLGYEPEFSLEAGLADYRDWMLASTGEGAGP